MQNYTTKKPPELSEKDKAFLFETAVRGLYISELLRAHGKNETVRTTAGAMCEAYTSMLKLSGRFDNRIICGIKEVVSA